MADCDRKRNDSRSRGIPERVLRIAKALYENYGADRVILFGSVARGEARDWPAIDLLVIKDGEEDYVHERIGRARLAIMDVKKGALR